MKKNFLKSIAAISAAGLLAAGCIDPIPGKEDGSGQENTVYGPPLSEIAGLLAELPFEKEHISEVHDAVTSSSSNGYDKEYTMSNLFSVPGAGVGDDRLGTKAASAYENPLSELIREHLMGKAATKSSVGEASFENENDVNDYINLLSSSDIQIYWPFSEKWADTGEYPIITFDPENESSTNTGYRIRKDRNGLIQVEQVVVDENMAEEYPVWVVNRNSDDGYLTLDMIRQLYPDQVGEGGDIVINPAGKPMDILASKASTGGTVRTLILKDFIMHRNYDSWFAGASEFFVKCGAVENFTASTEAELELYSPNITDFMIVVKRNQVGIAQPFNAVLVSDWTDQVDNCAFMIIEDDGGRQTSWECTALVRIASKSYGIEIDLPFRTRDDIVWRGSLSSRYLFAHSNVQERFGDVSITFEIEESGASTDISQALQSNSRGKSLPLFSRYSPDGQESL